MLYGRQQGKSIKDFLKKITFNQSSNTQICLPCEKCTQQTDWAKFLFTMLLPSEITTVIKSVWNLPDFLCFYMYFSTLTGNIQQCSMHCHCFHIWYPIVLNSLYLESPPPHTHTQVYGEKVNTHHCTSLRNIARWYDLHIL